MDELWVRVLGPIEVFVDGVSRPLEGRRQRGLLGLLCVHSGSLVSQERLIDELWGERPPRTAAKSLQNAVVQLRRALESDPRSPRVLLSEQGGYRLAVEADGLDAARFVRLVREGTERLSAGGPEEAVRLLEEGLSLWRGAAYADVAAEGAIAQEGARLEELRLLARAELLEAKLQLGHHSEIIPELRSRIAEDPLREQLRRLLMLALYRCGRHEEALEVYREARGDLIERLGIEPSAEFQALERSILNQDPALNHPVRDPVPNPSGALPTGVVTLLAAAVEDATRLMHELGDEYDTIVFARDSLLSEVWAAHSGSPSLTAPDAVLVAFSDPAQAVRAAAAAQRTVLGDSRAQRLPLQMAVHTGSPRLRPHGYWGVDVQYATQLCAAAHGGQVLVSAATASLIDVPLEDLGEHAVREFPGPRRIFHLAVDGRTSGRFPPLRTRRAGRTNLPDQISSFIGRERELAELRSLLADRRVVTLTGPGGVGKTRLALRLGAELLDGRGDGVWLVDLAPVVDPQLVGATLAAALGVPERPGQPLDETLGEALVDRALLLVVDNCEHLLGPVARLIAGIVERCPGILVLATSREPLGVPGEHVYRVPSLTLPADGADDEEQLARSEAVRLFVDRARQQRHDFVLDRENARVVARLCRRLDAIPLAIELAAVRTRSLSLTDLDVRLDRRFSLLRGASRTALPRQQTLGALIEWSYQLLTEAERRVLEQLGVFPGGFDLDAAEAVCDGAGIPPHDVLNHLDALVDKSLVQADDTSGTVRYRLLETIREFAGLKLADRGDSDVNRAQRAHRDHYLRLAEALHPVLSTPDRRRALDRMTIEQPNLRAALIASLADPDPDAGLRLATALQPLWKVRGPSEGAAELSRQLQRQDAQMPSLARGRALAVAADIYPETLGEYDTAIRYGEEALTIARRHRDDALAVEALTTLAWPHLYLGQFERALAFADEGVAIARACGGGYRLSGILAVRGALLATLGRDARQDLEEALDIARGTGNSSFIANALSNVGYLELLAGDPARARAYLEEAITIVSELDEPGKSVTYMINLGFACYAQDDLATAAHWFTDAIRTADSHDLPSPLATALLGAALTSTPSPTTARLRGAADALMHHVGLALDSFETSLAHAHDEQLQHTLGKDVLQAELVKGHNLKRSDAVALALNPELTHQDAGSHQAK